MRLGEDEVQVSIHAPREGCDLERPPPLGIIFGFNSRTPGGVRLILSIFGLKWIISFNSRTPGGVRLAWVEFHGWDIKVSIHAPREGCDSVLSVWTMWRYSFNSRTPGGVRRRRSISRIINAKVSIHAPREGCDKSADKIP